MSDKLPIIDQLHNAEDDRARADLLLRCSDAIMLKYETVFLNACRHFPAGELFVLQRTNAMRMVRSVAGGLPGGVALEIETLRAELAAFAAGASHFVVPDKHAWIATRVPGATPSLDI